MCHVMKQNLIRSKNNPIGTHISVITIQAGDSHHLQANFYS